MAGPSIDEIVEDIGVARAVAQQRVAGLILTYRCTIACAHCLFNCSPRHPRRVMTVEQGVRYIRLLRSTSRVVHIAGGEAMMEYDTVLAICREAGRRNARPHFIETNASWCTNDELARRRLSELWAAGVRGLLISADAYHFAFVPVDRYRRCLEAAVARFGEGNVMATRLTDEEARELRRIGRDPARLAEMVRGGPPQLVGRAGEELAQHLPFRDIEEMAGDGMWHDASAGMSCAQEFSPATMWEMHLDPDGNLQTCCGVILGNVERTSFAELIATEFGADNPILNAVRTEGPMGLLRMAEARGYQRERYVQKCHLCWQVRKFLRPHFPSFLGPDEIYGAAAKTYADER
jgi:MoaA/NifB/PqqE/SkfB family radical SAM enzyme